MRTTRKGNSRWRHQLLSKLILRQDHRQSGAISVAVGVVAALVLILSGVAVVLLTSSNLRGVFISSDTRQARAAAAEGGELMIDTWNQPQNRRLLVSGTDPGGWRRENSLRSPCYNAATGTRPGPGNDGLPDETAMALADGTWRDAVTGAAATATQNGRQFRLVRVVYSASDGRANPDPRVLRRTAIPGEGISGAALPTGFTAWDQLVNLNDPDGQGALQPGRNSGFLVLEVEGRVVRGGRVVAIAHSTREFEILPKCCGASLGSNNSGGVSFGAATGSLGSESRLCNLQYGIVTGFNDGWQWSFFANDQYTQRNPSTGAVERYGPMLGVVTNAGDAYNRATCRVRPGRGKNALGNCPATNDSSDPSVGDDNSFNTSIRNAGPPDSDEQICRQTGASSYFSGPETDIIGTSASCSPIVSLQATAFPPISSFVYGWTSGWGPSAIIRQASLTSNKRLNSLVWPQLNTDNSDGSASPNSTATIRLRTNANPANPRVEACLVDLTTAASDNCTAETWLDLTSRAARNNDYFGAGASASGSTPFLQLANTSTTPNSSLVIRGSAAWNSSPNLNATRFYVNANLNSFESPYLQTPFLELTISRTTSFNSSRRLAIEASPDNGTTWYPLTQNPIPISSSISTSGTSFRLGIPFSGPNIRIQLRDSAATSSAQWISGEDITINNLRISSSLPTTTTAAPSGVLSRFPIFGGPWCEYSTNSPINHLPGFHCLGPSINQYDGGSMFIDTTGGPLSFYYTEPTSTDLRFGQNSTNSPENFIYLSRSPAILAHVLCNSLSSECSTPIDERSYTFSSIGEPDRLNFYGRNSGSASEIQNILITTEFGTNAKVGGVWFYLPMGRVELRVTGGAANSVPSDFYTNNENNWSFFGRLWVSQFKPFGAFHLRVPDSRIQAGAALGTANPSQFVSQSGVDWIARATISTRNW